MPGPDRQFWQDRFERNETPWDRGGPGPQLLAWLEDGSLDAQSLGGRIAVPGFGSGHDVLALAQRGFDVVGIDYADAACERARARLAAAGATAELVQADVLAWRPGSPLAAVYEQTCLCAMHPDYWTRYAQALHDWLRPGGHLFLMGMQVSRPAAADGVIEGPPYNVPVNALRALFDGARWEWPAPPYPRIPHPFADAYELGLVLVRR
jgi:SAM-dependent methyltransferase